MRAEEAFEQAEEQLTLAKATNELATLQIDFGDFFHQRGNPAEAVRRYRRALPIIETMPGGQRELSRLHSLLIHALQASGDLGAALQMMRRAEVERSSVWHAVVWDLHPDLAEAAEEAYGRGDYQGAVTHAFRLVEAAVRAQIPEDADVDEKAPVTEIAKRFLGDTPALRDLIVSGFQFVRNPLAHVNAPISGIDALAGLLLAHLAIGALNCSPPAGDLLATSASVAKSALELGNA
jgi:hypothetical protein